MDILGTIFSDNLIILVYKMYDGWISNQEYLAILYIYIHIIKIHSTKDF